MSDFSKITALVEQKLVSLYIKRSAKRLQKILLEHPELETLHEEKQLFSLMRCQEILSQALGLGNFNQVLNYQKQQHMQLLLAKGFQFTKDESPYPFMIGYSPELKKNVYFSGHHQQRGYFGEGALEHSLNEIEKSIESGAGVIYFSLGKGKTYQRILDLAQEHHRMSNVQIINHSYHLEINDKASFQSSTFNPFMCENAATLTAMVMGAFLDTTEAVMWKGRALGLASTLMNLLTYYRDYKGMIITPEVVREYLFLDKLIEAYGQTDLPTFVQTCLYTYLHTLPGFHFQNLTQSVVTYEQHGYVQMQFVKLIGNLTETYGDIYNVDKPSVSYHQAFRDNQILIVLLPEKEQGNSLFSMHFNLCLESINHPLVRNTFFNKPNTLIYFDNCLSHMPVGAQGLALTASHQGLNIVYTEQKMPNISDNEQGAIMYEQILHKFFHKGVFPKLSLENQSHVTKLSKGHYIYQYGDIEMKLVS